MAISIKYDEKINQIIASCNDNFGRVREEIVTTQVSNELFKYLLANGLSMAEYCEYDVFGKTFRITMVENK